MNWKLMSVAGLMVIAIVTVTILHGPVMHAQAQGPTAAPAAYVYKVERVARNSKDIDRILTDDGKDGWRLSRLEAVGPYHNDLVFVMEKPLR